MAVTSGAHVAVKNGIKLGILTGVAIWLVSWPMFGGVPSRPRGRRRVQDVRAAVLFAITDVLVAGVHRIVERAQARSNLLGRIEKRFECFMPDKRADSARYPTIIHAAQPRLGECRNTSAEQRTTGNVTPASASQAFAVPPDPVPLSWWRALAASTRGVSRRRPGPGSPVLGWALGRGA
jgi:hypothetical protein